MTQARFCRWVTRGLPDRLGPDADRESGGDPRSLLAALSTSERIVPAEVAARLGAPADATYGRVATLLWWAHDAADGPRCRSYRAAAMLLSTAHPELLPDEPERPRRVTADAS